MHRLRESHCSDPAKLRHYADNGSAHMAASSTRNRMAKAFAAVQRALKINLHQVSREYLPERISNLKNQSEQMPLVCLSHPKSIIPYGLLSTTATGPSARSQEQ